MTPKEKAQDLLQKMAIKFQDGTSRHDLIPNFKIAENRHFRECAMIAVDEVIDALKAPPIENKGHLLYESQIDYWQQVKQELQLEANPTKP